MSQDTPHGVVHHPTTSRKTDFLYRVSLKGIVTNNLGEILVVKENQRTSWDLPGGGMDHTESVKDAIAREMREEVNLRGDFTYRIVTIDEPIYLNDHGIWQLRLVFQVIVDDPTFSPGVDGSEIAFIHPEQFRHSLSSVERKIYDYAALIQ